MLLLHWSKGYYDCQVSSIGSGKGALIEVVCTEKTTPKLNNQIKSYPIIQYPSFDSYWKTFLQDPKWFMTWPIYVHPSMKAKVQASINKILLRDLSTSEISYLDKWKTYLYFRIPSTSSGH